MRRRQLDPARTEKDRTHVDVPREDLDSDLAERMLGHAPPVIRKTYDKHKFIEEQRVAFEALSSFIEHIVNPPMDNVIALGAWQ